ncbi:hypothetical protein [Streptomyces griseorubiginosus]|uniref:hypothetical protein n=1 Tax=Streptomyces griseorubiginosus TaxID=67304 RepID=UPI00340119E1
MRHTVTTAATVLLLALATAGCGGGDDDAKTNDKPPTSAAPSPSSSEALAAQYLAESQQIPFTSHRPTVDELLDYPPKWCAALADGHSVEWMFSSGGGSLYPIGNDWGTVEADANKLLLVGVKVYCPKHLAAVTAELKAAGKY